MAYVEVRDSVVWAKHIHGDNALRGRLLGLDGGAPIRLRVDGFEGIWVKMDDGKDGRPTNGIKPIGPAKEHLAELFKTKRGEIVEVEAL